MKTRLWLMFQPRLVTQPVVYDLGKKFDVVTKHPAGKRERGNRLGLH